MYVLIILLVFPIINSNKNDTITNLTKEEKIMRIEDEMKILEKHSYDEIKEILEKNFPLLFIRIHTVNHIMRSNYHFSKLHLIIIL